MRYALRRKIVECDKRTCYNRGFNIVLAVSMGFNIWQFNNVREIEKPVEVPVEVPIEVFVPSENGPRRFERFLIKGSEHFHV